VLNLGSVRYGGNFGVLSFRRLSAPQKECPAAGAQGRRLPEWRLTSSEFFCLDDLAPEAGAGPGGGTVAGAAAAGNNAAAAGAGAQASPQLLMRHLCGGVSTLTEADPTLVLTLLVAVGVVVALLGGLRRLPCSEQRRSAARRRVEKAPNATSLR
jgi:hypothetical protein